MSDAGNALLGIGMGTGDKRAVEAAEKATSSPLLETTLEGAHGHPAVDHRRPGPVAVGGQRGGQAPSRRPPTRTRTSSSARCSTRSSRTRSGSPSSRPATRTRGGARRRRAAATRAREPAGEPRCRGPTARSGARRSTSTCRSSSPGSEMEYRPCGASSRPAIRMTAAGRRGGPPRRRQRGRRGAGRDAHLVRRRAAADRARRRRLHARRRPGRRGRAAGLLRRRAGHGRLGARRWSPSTSPSATLIQVFNIGAASCGVVRHARPACARRAERYGTIPLAELAAPAAALARGGRGGQRRSRRTCSRSSRRSPSTRRSRARCSCPRGGRCARARSTATRCSPTRSSGSARRAPAPFYTGEVGGRGGRLGGRARRHAHGARTSPPTRRVPREPVRVAYRGREVLTNPPPSAGGTLLAYALALLEPRAAAAPDAVGPGARRWSARSPSARPAFLDGLAEPGFLERVHGQPARLHDAHLRARRRDGWACAVTCTNGEGSGLVVPGTGVHVNNMMGEQDLSPLGFFTHPPGRRLPSMMAPTVVLSGGEAGARARLRGLQPDPLRAAAGDRQRARPRAWTRAAAVEAPRLHFEDGIVYAEPGDRPTQALEAAGCTIARVPRAQPVLRRLPGGRARAADGVLSGGGRSAPRRRGRGGTKVTGNTRITQ